MSKIFGLAGVLLFLLIFLPLHISASEVIILFEQSTEYQVARGVLHRQSRFMTEQGMLDVNTLIIDLSDPFIELAPVTTPGNLGRRETMSFLLREAGAVAGINADFFGLAGTYSTHFGPMVFDGQLLGASTYTNHTYDQFATFFIGQNGLTFMDYIRSYVRFYNNGRANIDISTYNSIGHALNWPAVVTRASMYNTADLNRRFCGLTKIVVDGSTIVYISQPGAAVDVPRLGYVVILPERMAYRTRYFSIGDTTLLQRSNNQAINFADLQMAIGGGALLLENGQATPNRGVAPAVRHPRSAIGVSRDGRTVILMTVDGRNHSVGANHGEMAYLMQRAGAFNAMHFDGGGSTTMVTSTRGEDLRVANTVADGSERRVINALGVFDNSTMGEIVAIHGVANVSRGIVGRPVYITVYGEDALWNRRAITSGNIGVMVDTSAGAWANGRYTPNRPGRHELTLLYGEFSYTKIIYASVLAELVPTRASINIFQGQRAALTFTGIGEDGATLPIPTVERRRVSPESLGHFEGDTFVATGEGAGYIAARVGDAAVFFPVYVSGFARQVNMFTGEITSDRYSAVLALQTGGRRVIRLEYEPARSTSAQTSRVFFEPPLVVPGEPNGLRLQVYGDGSGHGIRARVYDDDGVGHIVNFGTVNFTGWSTVIARLPNAPAPFTVEQIFINVPSWYELTTHAVLFYDLRALYAPEVDEDFELPESDRFVDALWRDEFDGGVAFTVPTTDEIEFTARGRGEFGVLTVAASGGGIFAADREQWQRILRDARALNRDNVVILLDANPLTFRQRMEFELLHLALLELRNEGRTVFVVSATGVGEDATLTMRDGVRYINLPRVDADEGEVAEVRFLLDNGEVVGWR